MSLPRAAHGPGGAGLVRGAPRQHGGAGPPARGKTRALRSEHAVSVSPRIALYFRVKMYSFERALGYSMMPDKLLAQPAKFSKSINSKHRRARKNENKML